MCAARHLKTGICTLSVRIQVVPLPFQVPIVHHIRISVHLEYRQPQDQVLFQPLLHRQRLLQHQALQPPVQSSTTAAASSAALSPGGIAGASIGGAALLFLFIGALIFLFKRKNNNAPPQTHPYVPSNASYQAPSYNDQHMSYMSNPSDSGLPPMATGQGYWTSAANQGGMGGGEIGGQMIAEMESPKNNAGQFGHLSVLSGGTLGEGGTSPASTAEPPGQQFARTTSPSPHSGQMSPTRKPVGGY